MWNPVKLKYLNSLTKFPSIFQPWAAVQQGKRPYYIGDVISNQFSQTMFRVTEKVDGTNARLIVTGDGWFIGAREELLAYSYDVLSWEQNYIVETLRPIAEVVAHGIAEGLRNEELGAVVLFGEVFGDGIQKRYRGQPRGFRVFAARRCPREVSPNPQIWRQTSAGFDFRGTFNAAQEFVNAYGRGLLTTVPDLGWVPGDTLADPRAALEWLRQFHSESRVVPGAQCEGVVLLGDGDYTKTDDGTRQRNIHKVKFEDFPRD